MAIHNDKLESFKKALACDPISSFGGIVSCNYKVGKKLALELNKIFIEIIIGNGFDRDAIKILKKRKNLRIIDALESTSKDTQNVISNFDNFLIQTNDDSFFSKRNFKIVSKTKPDKKTFNSLLFAFNVCRYVKSNAIVLATDT